MLPRGWHKGAARAISEAGREVRITGLRPEECTPESRISPSPENDEAQLGSRRKVAALVMRCASERKSLDEMLKVFREGGFFMGECSVALAEGLDMS